MNTPWGIISSTILLTILGIILIFSGFASIFSSPPIYSGGFSIILGAFLAYLGFWLSIYKSLAWWITLFVAVLITPISLAIIGYLAIFMMIFAILLLLGLLHRETITAIKPTGITYKGWILE